MINPYYSTDKALQVGFNTNLDSHLINNTKSDLIIKPKFPDLGIETSYDNEIPREMTTNYARFSKHYKLRKQRLYLAKFHKQDEDGKNSDNK